MRYGFAPSEIDDLPFDLAIEYMDMKNSEPSTLTFPDEASLMRYLAQH